ncbi:hypothetical protein ACVIVC_002532 [Sinorhizobium meliloti]
MPRNDEPVLEEFRLRIDGDDVADVYSELYQVVAVAGEGIDAQLDMAPACRLRVDLLVEGVTGSFQREN